MKNIFKASLKTKIILLALACNVILGVGAFFSIQKLASSYERTYLVDFEAKAKELGAAIANQFFERYGDVQAFAVNASIRNMDAVSMQQDLNDYIRLYGIYDLILVLDKNGKLVASNQTDVNQKQINQKALAEYNFAATRWYQAVLSGQFTEDKAKGFTGTYFDDVELDPVLKVAFGEDRYGATFASSIKDNKGEVIGMIVNKTNTRWYDFAVEDIYKEIESKYPNIELTILNKNGQAILQHAPARSSDKKNMVVYDNELILKEKFYKTENNISAALGLKKSGAEYQTNPINLVEDMMGYSYITHPKWISAIGWSVLIHNDKAQTLIEVKSAMTYFYWTLGVVFLGVFALASWAGRRLSLTVENITNALASNAVNVGDAATQFAAGATQLSSAAVQQSSSLQEVVATVDEINSMIQRNAEAAQKSKEYSGRSKNSAEQGRQTIDSMALAISEIENNNTDLSQQMKNSNEELSEITKMIQLISSKTKVIDDIVFQTKILSFNASIEAARAGEYGKGFAVVASEIGNLAQMSGGAAKEIAEMLHKSVVRVESIVDSTKAKTDKLVMSNEEKINFGSETAKQCKNALNEILEEVRLTDQLITEIAAASKEQSAGVSQITLAIGQLEEVANQNSSIAQTSAATSSQMREQTASLNNLVGSLSMHVNGRINVSKSKSKPQPKPSNTVLKFEKKRPPVIESASLSKVEPVFKKVSGLDIKTPLSSHPGFDET